MHFKTGLYGRGNCKKVLAASKLSMFGEISHRDVRLIAFKTTGIMDLTAFRALPNEVAKRAKFLVLFRDPRALWLSLKQRFPEESKEQFLNAEMCRKSMNSF